MSSASRGECVTTGGLCRPTYLCVAHFELHRKFSDSFSSDVVRLGVGEGVMVHVSGGKVFVWGFREGRVELSSGLSQPGEKIRLSGL